MTETRPENTAVTQLLSRMGEGDSAAFEEFLPLVYQELRRLASAYLRKERADHTLQPTAVVHEAYLRLAGPRASFENRKHFFAAAAQAMRRVLVDHARHHAAAKRPGSAGKVTLVDSHDATSIPDAEILSLHEALERLEQIDRRKTRVVELRYFGGLSQAEIAEVLGISVRTVARDWRVARLMLRRWLASKA